MIDRKSETTLVSRDLLRRLVNTMLAVRPHFREIQESDLDAIADLLTRGFVHRSREYWMRGLRRQGARPLPQGTPRFGFMLEHEGIAVGCLLLIYASKIIGGDLATRCNVSSWYVDPPFRNYAALFASMTQKNREVTYFNVTPAATTWPILEAQGFVTHCRGLCFSFPVFSPHVRGMTLEAVTEKTTGIAGLPDEELAMLRRHATYDCLSLVYRTADETLPFIFFSLRKRGGIIPLPAVQLGYCRSIADYVRCAGAIGRYLLLRGKPIVITDATGPVSGLSVFYTEARGRKYFKGPHKPRLGDLADTELAIYGM